MKRTINRGYGSYPINNGDPQCESQDPLCEKMGCEDNPTYDVCRECDCPCDNRVEE